LPPVSTLKDLHILEGSYPKPRWQDNVENTSWLEVLRPFAAVKNLYICKTFIPRIAPALQELVGGRMTKVLPTLENILLEGFQPPGPLHEGIEKFVGSRRLTSHPVAVPRWDKDSDSKWEMHWKIYDTLRFLFNVSICLTTTIFLSARLYIFLEYQCVPCDQ